MRNVRKLCLGLSAISLLILIIGLVTQNPQLWQPAALAFAVSASIGIDIIPLLENYQYTAWIITAVVAGMIYPSAFLNWGSFDLRNKWLILLVVQLVMFGMGIQMALKDFTGLASSGKGVLIGLLCQFSIMPTVGFLLTKVFDFEPEVAAGVVLIGACSSGLASNVMTYIARGNLPLSVTVTAIATLIAPIMTPFMMRMFAGTLIEVKFLNMMMEIIKIVIVPIGAALLHDYLKTASPWGWNIVRLISGISALWLLALPFGVWTYLSNNLAENVLQSVEIFSFFAGAVLVGLGYHLLSRSLPKLDSFMPYLSMFGIVYFTTVTTAAGRDNLLNVGLILFLAAVIHNAAGYFLGYWLSRAFGLNRNSARTIAFEVGLQNGGMASGLAGSMGKLGTVGLAAAVFSPWMNISGSILANYWRKQVINEEQAALNKEELSENDAIATPKATL
ncbi:bile acid:sodium symporter family protein [Paradesertivirga mongoliensis]|uniref:Bile acid:sodium symporter family protein n=1 Tax=Paradesertivirga mongoliensis TaxID=2100740 RepID=A0ABW4ZQW4_9SPHI|nr:bile acid:sodium symporter family protein [Pedobacter mongoliensis]